MGGILSAFRDALTTAEIGMHLAPGEQHYDALASVAEIVRRYVVAHPNAAEPHVLRQFVGAVLTLRDLAKCPSVPTKAQLDTIHVGKGAMLEIISKADVVGLEQARQAARRGE